MRQTEKLLQGLTYRCIRGELPREVTQVAYDSRRVEPGALFVCIRGSRQDGHQFIWEALQRGALVILTETVTDDGAEPDTEEKEGGKRAETARKQRRYWQEEELDVVLEEQNVCVLETPDTRIALASISRQWFDDPQKEKEHAKRNAAGGNNHDRHALQHVTQ